MKVIDRRIARLEVLLRPPADDLSEERAIGEMLIAGEWQRALQALEHQDTQLVKEWQSKRRLAYGTDITQFDFRDRTKMCAALNTALSDVPAETRYHIAALLMAADERVETQAGGKL